MIKIFLETIFVFFAKTLLLFQKILISLICVYRDSGKILHPYGIEISRQYVSIEGFKHLILKCGNDNASEENTIIMMGGAPTDSSESMCWMAAELCKKDSALLIYIFHLPFYEEYSEIIEDQNEFAEFNGKLLPFNREINLKKVNVDPKFSHEAQAEVTLKIFKKLNLKKAHFVAHDRGVIVFENLLISNSEIFISLSRGSQVWDFYKEEWAELAPMICVGPPHSFFIFPHQVRIIFSLVTFFKFPLAISKISEYLKGAKKGSEEYDRLTHLIYEANNPSKKYLLKFRQTMLQTDVKKEVLNREKLKKLDTKIMQFQGEDEFKFGRNGKLISDQPYFGIYNLFRNEVEDIYPGCVGQDAKKKEKQFIELKDGYSKLKLLPTAKFHTFALIPKSAHFNVIENPKGCANAVYDFINDI